MVSLFRWLLRGFLALAVLAVCAIAILYYFVSRSLPDYNASYRVAGIGAPVEIVRNNADVPHVFGKTDADVFYGLGFAQAQDRLWQMTMMRRTAQGRLSELFGQRTVKVDELLRRLDFYGLAQSSVAAQDAYTRTALEAYAAGVNAWIGEVNRRALGRGAPEFFLFSNEIAPWTPADSLAILKLMALQLSGGLEAEVLRARVSLALPAARLADILPDTPGAGIAALPDYASLFPDAAPLTRFALDIPDPAVGDPLSPFKPRDLAGASNAWAAAPKRSAKGASLLANDPHLGFTAPSIWYLARLELASGGVIGGTIPGIPAVIVGRSDSFGWGLTTAYVDDQDLFIEKLNPDNPDEVLTPDGYKPMTRRTTIINIKGAAPETITLYWTENGPVLSGDLYNIGTITPEGHVAALSWTALSGADTSMTAAMHLMQAHSVAAGLQAGADFVAPAQNLTMADHDGIAMKVIGAMPRRDTRSQSQGRIPSPGWIPTNRWQGVFAYSANPEFDQPAGGLLVNTNNKTVDRPFPLHVSFEWGDTQRIERARALLEGRQVHTRESFIEAQLDTVSFTARSLLPLIAKNLWFTGEAAPEGTPERQRQKALLLLADWNGEMNEHLPEPLIYAAWMRFLQDRLIRDDLGPLAKEFTHIDPIFLERVFRDTDGASAWCDIKQSAAVETCDDIARMALDDALVWIGEHFGKQIESLRWGDAHIAVHDHPVLGTVPILKYFVNIHQSTSGGDNTLLRGRTSGEDPDPYLNVHGAGYRGVYDFADPDSSVFISSTGQSGHPLSRFYDNLGELWRRGEYVPMSLDPELARAGAVGITHLTPGG